MTNPNPVQESNRTQQETNQAVTENEQIAEEIQNQPNVPPRYEDMIKMTNIHEAAAPRDSGIKISRPLNDVRDSRGISETGGEIKNR
jgi:hypothetical protein